MKRELQSTLIGKSWGVAQHGELFRGREEEEVVGCARLLRYCCCCCCYLVVVCDYYGRIVWASSSFLSNLFCFLSPSPYRRDLLEESQAWKNTVRPVMELFLERTPGSAIRERVNSLSWLFHEADNRFGSWQVSILILFCCDFDNHQVLTPVSFSFSFSFSFFLPSTSS